MRFHPRIFFPCTMGQWGSCLIRLVEVGSQLNKVGYQRQTTPGWSSHVCCPGIILFNSRLYISGTTLWWTNSLQWRITMFNGKIHYKWPFSIAMLVHQRVPTHGGWVTCPKHISHLGIMLVVTLKASPQFSPEFPGFLPVPVASPSAKNTPYSPTHQKYLKKTLRRKVPSIRIHKNGWLMLVDVADILWYTAFFVCCWPLDHPIWGPDPHCSCACQRDLNQLVSIELDASMEVMTKNEWNQGFSWSCKPYSWQESPLL